MSYDCCCTRNMNCENHKEMLATDKLCLNLLSLLIHRTKNVILCNLYLFYFAFLIYLVNDYVLLKAGFQKHKPWRIPYDPVFQCK